MIRLIVIVALVYLCYRALKAWILRSATPIEEGDRRKPAGHIDDVMVKDPFCEVYFPRRKGVPLKRNGKELLFCSKECRDNYEAKKNE